jgi:hypothetical protein
MARAYTIRAGDKVISHYGVTKGKTGTVIKVFPNPPSITVGFDPRDPDLSAFIVPEKSKLVEFRLMLGEFEPVNKTITSFPTNLRNN